MPFGDILQARYYKEYCQNSIHQDSWVCACVFKHAITDKETNAFFASKLGGFSFNDDVALTHNVNSVLKHGKGKRMMQSVLLTRIKPL
jgi:hypothetical protein